MLKTIDIPEDLDSFMIGISKTYHAGGFYPETYEQDSMVTKAIKNGLMKDHPDNSNTEYYSRLYYKQVYLITSLARCLYNFEKL